MENKQCKEQIKTIQHVTCHENGYKASQLINLCMQNSFAGWKLQEKRLREFQWVFIYTIWIDEENCALDIKIKE